MKTIVKLFKTRNFFTIILQKAGETIECSKIYLSLEKKFRDIYQFSLKTDTFQVRHQRFRRFHCYAKFLKGKLLRILMVGGK